MAFTNVPERWYIAGSFAATGIMSLTSAGATATLLEQGRLRAVTYSNRK